MAVVDIESMGLSSSPSSESVLGWHVTMRADDGRVLAPTIAARRLAVGVVMHQGAERRLLQLAVADTHVHAVVLAHREAAGRFAHDVETSLRWTLRLPVRFEAARLRPIRTQAHLHNTFWYLSRQDHHHGTVVDPTYEGTAVPDILGARVMLATDGPWRTRVLGAGIGRCVATHLPRVRGRDLLELIGGARVLELADEPGEARRLDPDHLRAAAAAAIGCADVRTSGILGTISACAAAHAAAALRTSTVAELLGLSMRTVQAHRRRDIGPDLVRAVRLQWAMRSLAADRIAAERIAAERIAAGRIAADRIAADRIAADRIAADRIAADRIAADRIAADRLAADRLTADRLTAERLAADRLAAAG